MEEIVKDVLAALDKSAVPYTLLEHAPAAHMDDCKAVMEAMNAVMPRNLFLTTRRQGGLWLGLLRPDAPFRSGKISRQISSSRLCFADEAALESCLRVKPGSITPLALLFDTEKRVTLLIDSSLKREEQLIFHPGLNTYSVRVRTEDFLNRFLPMVDHEPVWIEVTA